MCSCDIIILILLILRQQILLMSCLDRLSHFLFKLHRIAFFHAPSRQDPQLLFGRHSRRQEVGKLNTTSNNNNIFPFSAHVYIIHPTQKNRTKNKERSLLERLGRNRSRDICRNISKYVQYVYVRLYSSVQMFLILTPYLSWV